MSKININIRLFSFLILLVGCYQIALSQSKYHTIKQGETFESIAQLYDISEKQLKEANKNVKTVIVGVKLLIPQTTDENENTTHSQISNSNPVQTPIKKNNETVQSNHAETLKLAKNNSENDYSFFDESVVDFERYEDFVNRRLEQLSNCEPLIFEGQLQYRNYSYFNNLIKNMMSLFGQGQLFNGQQNIDVVIKGNNVHIYNNPLHDHLLILDNDKYYVYNDITKKGIKFNKKDFDTYYAALDPEHKIEGNNLEKKVNIDRNNVPIYYKDDRCYAVKGDYKIGDSAENYIEMWISKSYIMPDNYNYVFYKFPLDGIVKKGIYSSRSAIPLLGNAKGTQAWELVSLFEYPVSDEAFKIPSDVSIENFSKNSQYLKYGKESTKALKRNKMQPEKMKAKEVQLLISEQWDFADEWMKKNAIDNSGITWASVGNGLLSFTEDIMNIVQPASTQQSTSTLSQNNSLNYSTTGKQYEIRKLLEIQYSGRQGLTNLSKKGKAPDNDFYMNWNNEAIAFLNGKLSQGFEYISSEEWDEFNKPYVAESDRKMAIMRANHATVSSFQKGLVDRMKKSNYNNFQRVMDNWSESETYAKDPDFYRRTLNEMQRDMKKNREELGLKKSPWEDWSGTPYTKPTYR